MKLKYKKIILLTSLSTMGIGLLTLSISQGSPKAEEKVSATSGIVSNEVDLDEDETINMYTMKSAPENTEDAEVPTVVLTPTPIPTPTPAPVYPLEKMEGMDVFIEEFYIAKVANDFDKLRSIYLDPTKVETEEQLQNKVQYIEEYKNIETHSKKSFEDGAYIVYAYHEIKFSSINTLAPGLSKFYVITDDDGNFKILSDMHPEVEEYFNARNDDEDVLELIDYTNTKGEEAKAKDEDLMIFWNGLDELAKSNGEESEETDQPE